MKKSIVFRIIVLNLIGLLCFPFLVSALFGKPAVIKNKPPLVHQVDEIAADGDCFYTLDHTLKYICKYSNEGEFQYAMSFSSTGTNYIFIDTEGHLNRYDLRLEILFAYDDDGQLLSEKSLTYQEFDQIRDRKSNKYVTAKGVEYIFANRLVGNSYVQIIHENNTTKNVKNVTVETALGHAIWNFVILAFLAFFAAFAYSIFQLVCCVKGKNFSK